MVMKPWCSSVKRPPFHPIEVRKLSHNITTSVHKAPAFWSWACLSRGHAPQAGSLLPLLPTALGFPMASPEVLRPRC